jgi:two-component system sensor histidine kinase DctS
MARGEFQFDFSQTEGESFNTSTPLNQVESVSVADLEGVLDIIDEEIVLIQRSTGKILWMSSVCKGITHKLGATENIDEFPQLLKLINENIPDTQGVRHQARWHTADSEWNQYIGDNSKSSVSVLVRPENNDQLWLRFKRSSEKENYIRQALAYHEELFSTSKAISVSEMVTTLAHELNQPLGTLVNLMNGIQTRLNDKEPRDEDVFEALALAQKQGQFASDILSRLRDFAQSKKPASDKCDIIVLVQETISLLDWAFDSEGVNVSYNANRPEIFLQGDSTLLQQVLVNLLRNSVDAMSENDKGEKRIAINVSENTDDVKIEISDNGHGIDDNHEDSMFTPFISTKTHGMGVGLNICRSFIELHEGQFWLSQNKDGGCSAHIVLPGRMKYAS